MRLRSAIADLRRRPGIHNPHSWLWIPASRHRAALCADPLARPGMTCSGGAPRIQHRLVVVSQITKPQIAIIGAGPAGLMAAEVLARGGARVTVYDAMPSAGRKLLMGGRGGVHSEE